MHWVIPLLFALTVLVVIGVSVMGAYFGLLGMFVFAAMTLVVFTRIRS